MADIAIDKLAPAGRQRLRREPGGRKLTVTVRVSEGERARLDDIAAGIGISTQRMMLESSLARRTLTATEVVAIRREFRMSRRQVSAMRQHLADIAEAAQDSQLLPPEFPALADEATRTLRRLQAALDALPNADDL